MDVPETDNFHGVYLLVSQNEKPFLKGKCYIGYTVDPNRRIRQHNKGKYAGGAKKTDNRGPWIMVMIIHGFPVNTTALQFEWAWQNPDKSLRLKQQSWRRNKGESHFKRHLRILYDMLRMGPWNRLPLCVRWLSANYVTEFPVTKIPPNHMTIRHGQIKIKRPPSSKNAKSSSPSKSHTNRSRISIDSLKSCYFCTKTIFEKSEELHCLNKKCYLVAHVPCMANEFLKNDAGHYIPIEGTCPMCQWCYLWNLLLLKKNNKVYDLDNLERDLEESSDSLIDYGYDGDLTNQPELCFDLDDEDEVPT